MLDNKILIIDFDSTFIKVETLDELAKIILENDVHQESKIKKITEITNLAMNGEIDFPTALKRRLEILSLTKQDVEIVNEKIKLLISDSFIRNKEFIQNNAEKIWIVSGGFKDVIIPVLHEYGIKPNHVLANEFLYDNEKILGCNEANDLFKEKGKILAIENQNLNGMKIMIGDGYTDYEVYENGTADYFIYYSENINREKVSSLTDFNANSFEELIRIVEGL